MKNTLALNDFGIIERDGQPVTTSLKIAEIFEKEHDSVMRTIKTTIGGLRKIAESSWEENFTESFYKNAQNKKQPCYLLTKKGFSLIAMSFTGEKALIFKTKYIDTFEAMEFFIKNLFESKTDFPEFTNAIMSAHEEPKSYHFSNEIDMINRIVLGISSKQYREKNNIESGKSIRPYLTNVQLELVRSLQRIDIGLIISMPKYEERKALLEREMKRLLTSKKILQLAA